MVTAVNFGVSPQKMTFLNFNLLGIRVFLLAISIPFDIVLVMKFVGFPFHQGLFPTTTSAQLLL